MPTPRQSNTSNHKQKAQQNTALPTHVNNSRKMLNSSHPTFASPSLKHSTRKLCLLMHFTFASKPSACCGTNALVIHVMSAFATLAVPSRGCQHSSPQLPSSRPAQLALAQSRPKPANNNQHLFESLPLHSLFSTTLKKHCTCTKGCPSTSHSLACAPPTLTSAKTAKGSTGKQHGSLSLITSPASNMAAPVHPKQHQSCG